MLAGGLRVEDVAAKAAETLGREWTWLRPLATRYVAAFEGVTRPRLHAVAAFLEADAAFRRGLKRHGAALRVERRIAGPQPMLPVLAAADWGVPRIETMDELADWLRLSAGELEWFADLKNLQRRPGEALRHYSFQWVPKRSGGMRLIEAPKQRMKGLQRQILAEILDRVPAHPAAHGFVRGRSIQTFAAPHVGRERLLRIDLKDFFPSVRRTRVQALFRTLGYPEAVADRLGGIVTVRTPLDALRGAESGLRAIYRASHLPQGAPTSPALANAACYRLDCRLAGLAQASGATYTRYADDLAFSGDAALLRGVGRFAAHVAAVVQEEGLAVNFRKTRTMRQGVRQHLAGLVVNDRLNTGRAGFDRLKAILTNCARNGPAVENRERREEFQAHLAGRVAFVASVNAARGEKLRGMLARIDWQENG